MLIQTPSLSADQVENWMQEAAATFAPAADTTRPVGDFRPRTDFDFKKVRQALQRARAKTSLRTIKPLRRLRTDQAAVNESLSDAVGALLNVNKAMATELAALATQVAELRAELSARAAAQRGASGAGR
jgi:hypothetical protein